MTTATTSFLIEPNAEPLPGYRLEKRIGTGGYGEVWKAIAPGGLSKAIKIIHGQIDGNRAVREMRSLERAKSLNHPFLLSLERIEIVDGHLLIVTELADATLRDRFDVCRGQGLPGIPRDELLEYMREAADALDYLFDGHALQHLDVKPENLLLRGRHVKVADFGLLKDLQESCASFVNGMTPKYSPPELFGGKPGRYSDQYSLAIVYQEMVSGQLPFAGSNIASLASQHLHAAPDLTALEPLERFAIGKALSKDPQNRFPSCRAFVERLMRRSSSVLTPAAHTKSNADSPDGRPMAREKGPRQARETPQIHDGHTIEIAAPAIRTLPRLLPLAGPITYRPVVFIGIGGTGGRVLSKLRQLISDRIGESKDLPALQFLYIDTDADALASVAKGPCNEGLIQDEILITPLRQTQDYRSAAVSNLDSLSRRWIYNIPRSLRTQGLRALGRIALLDHADRLLDRMRRAVTKCTDGQSVATTSEHSKLAFEESDPRVFVVASICGGAGGGMVIDAAYAIRQVLAECGFTDDDVCGILTCSTAPGSGAAGVAPANAFSCLEELRYFSQPGCDYPGEPTCGLSGFRGDGPTFRNTYLFDVGERSTSNTLCQGTDLLAEYLYLSTVSATSTLFDQCRRLERETPSSEVLRVRTAGICPFAAATSEDPAPFAERLCRFLVRKWKSGIDSATSEERVKLSETDRLYEACDPHGEVNDSIKDLGQVEMDRIGINVQSVGIRLVAIVANKLNSDPRTYMQHVIDDSLAKAGAEKSQLLQAVDVALRRIRMIIGGEEDFATKRSNQVESLSDLLRPEAQAIGAQLGEALAGWILELVDTGSSRVDGARKAVKWVNEFLPSLQQAATRQAEIVGQELQTSQEALSAMQEQQRPVTKDVIGAALLTYAACEVNVQVQEAVGIALRAVDPFVTAASDQLRELWKDLTQLADCFQTDNDGAAQANHSADALPADQAKLGPSRMADLFATQQRDLIEELDQAIEAQFFKEGRRLRETLTSGGHVRDDLAAQMRAWARKIVLRACHRSIQTYLGQALTRLQNNELSALLRNCLETARPGLIAIGGAKRLLLSIPQQLDVMQLARGIEHAAQERVSISLEQEGDLKFCYEIEDLPWEGIQTKLIRQRHDCADLAGRLHTRVNIDWTVV